MKKHPYYQKALVVYQLLKKHGYTVYLAGGCVRDYLLGRIAQDFDFASNATPQQIQQLFPDALMVGARFGTAIVIYEGVQFEITTFRNDGNYQDGRHPDKVEFSNPEEDAKRRDFTINALFYDLGSDQVIDYVGGESDLKKKLIKAVGNPEVRFQEDHLRMLRAVRFVSQLGFSIDTNTALAIKKLHQQISKVSQERIQIEIKKLIEGPFFEKAFLLFEELNLSSTLFPGLKLDLQIYNQLLPVADKKGWVLFFTTALYSGSKPQDIEVFIKFLKLSREDWQSINQCLDIQNKLTQLTEDHIGQWVELLFTAANLQGFRYLKQAQLFTPEQMKSWQSIDSLFASYSGVKPKPLINGNDLKECVQGQRLGQVLQQIYWLQLTKRVNSKEEALSLAKKII